METDKRTVIDQESVIDARSSLLHWFAGTLSEVSGGLNGFRVTVNTPAVTKPDRVIFADWQRLYSQIWDMMRLDGKEFNLGQSTLSDAAVYHNYDPVIIRPAGEREMVVIIEGVNLPPSGLTAEAGANGNVVLSLQKMNILNNLLEEVNRKIKRGEEFSPADYAGIIALLEEIIKNPEKEYREMLIKVNILNNLLEVINSMINSDVHSAEEIRRLNEIIQHLEPNEAP